MAIFGKKKYEFGDDSWDDNGYIDDPVDDTDDIDYTKVPEPAPAEPVAPVAPAPTFTPAPVALKIITPKVYDDAREITEYLMNGNTILLNMDGINRELAIRVIDYLKGAVQVVGGMMTKVGKTTLVIAPKNVDVSSIEAMVGSSAE